MDEDVDTQGWEVKGSGEGTGKGEDKKKKDGQKRASRGKRVMPMRLAVTTAGLPDLREASAAAANTHGIRVIIYKRKRLKSDAGSDGPVEKPRKRHQTSPRSDGGGFSRTPLGVPVAVAHKSRVVPEGSPLDRPFIGSNAVEMYSPSGCCSVRLLVLG